jgi:AAA domain
MTGNAERGAAVLDNLARINAARDRFFAEHKLRSPTIAEALGTLQDIFAGLPDGADSLWQPEALAAWTALINDTDQGAFTVARDVVRKRCGQLIVGILDRKIGREVGPKDRAPPIWFDECGVETGAKYLVKDVARVGDFVVIFGPSGCGKTFLTIDFACRIAAGLQWRGRAVQPGLCVYVAAEAGSSLEPRIVAWKESFLAEGASDTPMVIIPYGLNLLNHADVSALLDVLRAIVEARGPVSLLVLDTLSRCLPGGEENGAEAMTTAIGAIDRIRAELGCAVVCVHHSGKDASKGPRGHSSLFAAADVVIEVDNRIATVEKSRDGATGESFGFDLKVVEVGVDSDGDPITSCIVRHRDDGPIKTKAAPKLTNNEQIALSVLREAIHGESATDLPATSGMPRTRGVRMEQWREAYYRRSGESVDRKNGAEVKAFQRARDGLLAKNVVGASTPWVWTW